MSGRSTQLHEYKQQSKKLVLKEKLIRQFNLKMFDRVINALEATAAQDDEVSSSDEDADEYIKFDDKEFKLSRKEVRGARQLGKFLYEAKGLDKNMIGYYFGEAKPFNQRVCREFLDCFSFRNLSIDVCWRLIFLRSGLPKEGQ